MEYPDRDGADTGIDLVARQRDDGELCAIQCKCYADNENIDHKTISTFISKASELKIKHKILAYTGDKPTNHADRNLRGNKVTVITKDHFRSSSIDWSSFPKLSIKKPHKLREHQKKALTDVMKGFQTNDRGKMIMACGTGKTLTALHVAEKQVGLRGIVLYLVPSISLILQSMREWSENANLRHSYMAVCSDKSTGEDGSITELESPVSTDSATLKPYIKNRDDSMMVIFSTYHSIEVVEKAIKGKKFDLVLCDEAHRTTGTEGKSYYTRVHDDSKLPTKKRLYMTATPRVYSDAIKSLGKRKDKVIYSMDDSDKYGPEFHKLSFTDAVHKYNILADFKVKIAIVDADKVDADFQQSVADKDRSMPLDERTLLAAVWHGMNYPTDDESKQHLLQRVITFCNRIDRSEMFAGVMKDPNDIDRSFEGIVRQMNQKHNINNSVEVRHIDGKDNALYRRKEMRWLGDSNDDPKMCRILSNARCLSEGVDVPALDGVVFLNPRKSVVDVVQSVGRVMRLVRGKDYGYIILPVAIPAGLKYEEAMNDNKSFKVVWEVLNALRSHDEEFAREINKLILDRRTERTSPVTNRVSISILGNDEPDGEPITKFFDKIKSKIVEKVGDINYYDKYGQKLGDTTHTIEARIKTKIKKNDSIREEIKKFHQGLKELINESVTEESTIQAISQHMVLARVFDELFSGEFSSHNPISIAFEEIISKIGLREELTELEDFYEEVSGEIAHVRDESRESRQEFIKKIYGNFFESADKKGAEKHGIVYTPVEVIDFIINSIQHILKTEFGTEFNDRNVKILDPFTGTGTFLVRLLESGYIDKNVYEKYKHDMLANEIILLAYYIATVNIETTYQSLRRGKYVPFGGISYTDTLNINPRYRESKEHRQTTATLDGPFKELHERIRQQRGTHLHVIMGNPPYSGGQKSFNEQNQNTDYPELDKRIVDTYSQKSNSHAKNALYDSYVRSLRWATDRIGNSGIIAFITNASFIRSDTASGIRASLYEEFTDVWCFDLKGNGRITGDGRNIFEYPKQGTGGTRTPVTIIILVKNPKKQNRHVWYYGLEEKYYSGQQKRDRVKELKSIENVKNWQTVKPDKYNDWVEQRNEEFYNYTPIGSKEAKSGNGHAIFGIYSAGVKTNRDVWAYNSSVKMIEKNMRIHIDYCRKQDLVEVESGNVVFDSSKVKWTGELTERLKKTVPHFNKKHIRIALYRPFFKQFLYFDKIFNNSIHQIPKMFPKGNSENLVINIPYKGTPGMFSALITDSTPDLNLLPPVQCFPFHIHNDTLVGGGGQGNLIIIIPYKFTGQFSAFVTNTTPDIQVQYNGQCFPFYYYTEGRLRREYT